MSKVASALLLLSVSLVAILSARYALADFYYDRAKLAFDSLNISELNYSYEFDSILVDVNKSLKLRRNSADSLDFKADLLYQSWWLSPDGQYLKQSELLTKAANLHQEALNLRNNWSFSIARLALIYSHQATLDQEFDQWFIESHRLGLYETQLARSLMAIGLRHWDKLSLHHQVLTIDFIRASIEQKANSAQMMIVMLDRYEKHEEICRRLAITPRQQAVCE